MKSETIIEVIEKLVGSTEPYGAEHIDKTHLENQEKLIDIAAYCLTELRKNAEYKDRYEASMSRIGSRAYDALKDLKELFDDILD